MLLHAAPAVHVWHHTSSAVVLCGQFVPLSSTNWSLCQNLVSAAQTAAWQETVVQPECLAGTQSINLSLLPSSLPGMLWSSQSDSLLHRHQPAADQHLPQQWLESVQSRLQMLK